MALLLGTASVDITPTWPVPLAGFASRAGLPRASQTARPLRLRVLAFADSAVAGAIAVLVSADLIWWGNTMAATLRHRISRVCGLPQHAVFLHATHTHSGPQTADKLTALLGEPDPRYLAHLADQTVLAVAQAMANTAPVTVTRSRGRCAIGINRRGTLHGRTVLRPDPHGPVDPEVTVLRFADPGDGVRALLVHFACHPVISDANRFSSDFCGAAMDELEAQMPDPAVSVFAQGCCGDVNPAMTRDESFYNGNEMDVAAVGHELAAVVHHALDIGREPLGPVRLATAHTEVSLPLQAPPTLSRLRHPRADDVLDRQWTRLLLANPDRLRATTSLTLTALRLTRDLILCGFGAEPTTGYGTHVKKTYADTVLPLGYTNGMLGYLVTAAEAAAGGYEAYTAPRYFGMPAPLALEAEPMVHQAVADLLATLPPG